MRLPPHRRRRDAPLALSVGLAIALAVSADSQIRVAAQTQQPGSARISAAAVAQIEALILEKQSRNPIQRKIDSQLLYELKMQQGQLIAAGVPRLETKVAYELDGLMTLDVRAQVSDPLLSRLTDLGAELVDVQAAYGSVRLRVGLLQIESIAAMPEVILVQPKQEAITSRGQQVGAPLPRADSVLRRTRAARADRLQRSLVGQQQGITNVGSANSEGDVTHRAAFARATYGVDGTGVKVGVLSDGVDGLLQSQGSGDLGPVTVLAGQGGSGAEGTAMLEIIHDLAPGAQLYFATAGGGVANFANNIHALRTAGCDIIVDDVAYLVESPFQDGQTGFSQYNSGVVAQAVKDVTANGALYFSSAGNEGSLDRGRSGTWEGDFVDGGDFSTPPYRMHLFSGQTYDVQTVSGGVAIALQWADPLGGSANDYDLIRLNSTGTAILAASTSIQDGTQDAFEAIPPGAAGDLIMILKYAGASRFMHLDTWGGRLSIATAGEIHGHAAVNSANAFGVAATSALAAYPNPFNASHVVESFSSDGPRRIFFTSNGTAFTPGNFTSTGGIVLNKPDITAADGVSVTGVGGFVTPFFGTSAAAPHAAAIAALAKSRNVTVTAAQVTSALLGSAIDIMAPGWDRDSGFGIVMANTAVAAIPCGFVINPTSRSVDAPGGPGTVGVTAVSACPWIATSNNPAFLTVTGGSTGTGNGTVSYTVATNLAAPNVPTAPRTGTLTIAGLTFTVNQIGCSFDISPTAEVFGKGAGGSAVAIAAPSGCSWTVTGLPPWASTTSGAGGTGNGSWQYAVAANGTAATRSQVIPVAGQSFTLTQSGVTLKPLTPGTFSTFTLTNAIAENRSSIEAVAGRSYCVQLASAATEVTRSTPTVEVRRADGTTVLGVPAPGGSCFIAPASETALFRVIQTDPTARKYRLNAVETTLWANWFFVGGNYSSYTLLRNTTDVAVNATITWRSDAGDIVASQSVVVSPGQVVFRDARGLTGGASAGSVEVAHTGEPKALVGSQTTLSATTGLSFDTLLMQRLPR